MPINTPVLQRFNNGRTEVLLLLVAVLRVRSMGP